MAKDNKPRKSTDKTKTKKDNGTESELTGSFIPKSELDLKLQEEWFKKPSKDLMDIYEEEKYDLSSPENKKKNIKFILWMIGLLILNYLILPLFY